MKITDFDIYAELLQDKAGLSITQDQTYILESRLNPVAKKWGYRSLEHMTMALHGVPDADLVNAIVEAMTSNDTAFFANQNAFDVFQNHVLKYFKSKRNAKKPVRIWCPSVSSGQEAYSLAILIRQIPDFTNWNFEILGSDLSAENIELAREGRYSQSAVQHGLPIQLLVEYFDQVRDQWRVKKDIRNFVEFKHFNLLDRMDDIGLFDAVFCPNVLDCLDPDTQQDVLSRMAEHIVEDGFIVFGADDTLPEGVDSFKAVYDARGLFAHRESKHPESTTLISKDSEGKNTQALA